MHSSLLVGYRGRQVMIDCGEDWLGRVEHLRPAAIVITHAHPDHAGGLRAGVACTVYATRETWERLPESPIDKRLVVEPRRAFEAQGLVFEAFEVEHSFRAPAVGYRIRAGKATIFYVPDVVRIPKYRQVLSGVKVYVGDGAALSRGILRNQDGHSIGHTSAAVQLRWCKESGVPAAIFTHCGSVVLRDETRAEARLEELAAACRIEAEYAYDGRKIVLG